MAGISQKEYNEFVDEALVMFGGGAPCTNIDARLWGDFKVLFKQYNTYQPKVVDWTYDQVIEWMEEYNKNDS